MTNPLYTPAARAVLAEGENAATCFKCGVVLGAVYFMVNVAPDAASGGSFQLHCSGCARPALATAVPSELATLRARVESQCEILDETCTKLARASARVTELEAENLQLCRTHTKQILEIERFRARVAELEAHANSLIATNKRMSVMALELEARLKRYEEPNEEALTLAANAYYQAYTTHDGVRAALAALRDAGEG